MSLNIARGFRYELIIDDGMNLNHSTSLPRLLNACMNSPDNRSRGVSSNQTGLGGENIDNDVISVSGGLSSSVFP